MGQEYWSELPFPASGDLPDPGIEPNLQDSLPLSHLVYLCPLALEYRIKHEDMTLKDEVPRPVGVNSSMQEIRFLGELLVASV